jgi:hypothetical protein
LRAAFRVCHDFESVFGFGFSFLCDSRLFGGAVVDAMYSSCDERTTSEPRAPRFRGDVRTADRSGQIANVRKLLIRHGLPQRS